MAPKKKQKPKKPTLSPEEKALARIDLDAPVIGRKGINQIPTGWGREYGTGAPLTSGFGKPDPVTAQFEAVKQYGALKASEDITRAGVRLEEHHIILQKLLEPFTEGRSIREADEILKQVSKNLGGRPLGNNPGNLISLIKELHIKSKLSAHGILKRYYDFQGAKQFVEYDQITKFPKIHGDVDFGQKFGNWYQLTNMQDGWSLDMIEAIQKMPKNKAADILTGYLEFSIPRLEGAALAALWLDPTSRRNGVALREMNKMPNGQQHLMETLSDIKLQETQTWNKTAPGKISEGLTKGEQSGLHKESQKIWHQLNSFNQDAERFGLPQIELSDIQREVTPTELKPKPLRTDIPKTREQLLDAVLSRKATTEAGLKISEADAAARAGKYQQNINLFNSGVDDLLGGGGPALATEFGAFSDAAVYTDEIGDTARALGLAEDVIVKANPEAAAKLAASFAPGTGLMRRAAGLMPIVGAAADAYDVQQRYNEMMNNPNEGLADHLDKLQFAIAGGTAATTWWAEPVNLGLGVTNMAIDIGRTIAEEDKREDFMDTMTHLGAQGAKAFGRFF